MLSAAQSTNAISKSLPIFIGGLGVICTILIWFVGTYGVENNLNRFEPISALEAMIELFKDHRFWTSLIETMKRLVGALAAAVIIGVPIGILIGYFKSARHFTYVPFQLLRMVSPLSWTPIAIILFGIGSAPVYFLVFIAAVWPIVYSTAGGISSANPVWLDVGKSFGGSDWDILRRILIRATIPSILLGMQLALGVAWIVIVPAEMLGVASGLGYMILDFRDVNDYASIAALILVIGFLGVVLDFPLRWLVTRYSW
ncbi:ABC transporter permease [Hellea balneolensis]|uniref:ABC transporter permease n=1 Tax=Hellea balneolensis TaxID=287478 RepID=UPI0003F79E67|nr:ABC transporter permease [Hellea balneolensis]